MKQAITITLTILASAAMLTACSMAGGPSDEEMIAEVLAKWAEAGVAQDLDGMMVLYSEDFQNYEFGDKAGWKSFVQDAIDMGYLEDAEVDLEDAKTTIEGDTATVYPIEMTAAFGSATIELVLTKEADGWMITGMYLLIREMSALFRADPSPPMP